jgi:hypothetical protein
LVHSHTENRPYIAASAEVIATIEPAIMASPDLNSKVALSFRVGFFWDRCFSRAVTQITAPATSGVAGCNMTVRIALKKIIL